MTEREVWFLPKRVFQALWSAECVVRDMYVFCNNTTCNHNTRQRM
jgi:hypothetical protein